jgi:hypothetical protein
LISSLPLWLIAGVSTSVAAAASSHLEVDPQALRGICEYARFPKA